MYSNGDAFVVSPCVCALRFPLLISLHHLLCLLPSLNPPPLPPLPQPPSSAFSPPSTTLLCLLPSLNHPYVCSESQVLSRPPLITASQNWREKGGGGWKGEGEEGGRGRRVEGGGGRKEREGKGCFGGII